MENMLISKTELFIPTIIKQGKRGGFSQSITTIETSTSILSEIGNSIFIKFNPFGVSKTKKQCSFFPRFHLGFRHGGQVIQKFDHYVVIGLNSLLSVECSFD